MIKIHFTQAPLGGSPPVTARRWGTRPQQHRPIKQVVAVGLAKDAPAVWSSGLRPSAPPDFGHWSGWQPELYRGRHVHLSDTYGFQMARALGRAARLDAMMVVLSPLALDHSRMRPDPLMMHQLATLDVSDQDAPRQVPRTMDECLSAFGMVLHEGPVPPGAVVRTVVLRDLGNASFGNLQDATYSIKSFPLLRGHLRATQNWFAGGCVGPMPKNAPRDQALRAPDADWARERLAGLIRERVEVIE